MTRWDVRDARGRFARLCPDCGGQGLMNAITACRSCGGTGVKRDSLPAPEPAQPAP